MLVTGLLSAQLGGSPRRAAVIRLVGGGALAMIVTFGIGQLLGTAVAKQPTPPHGQESIPIADLSFHYAQGVGDVHSADAPCEEQGRN